MTKWLYYFSKFGHEQHLNAAQKHYNFVKVGSKVCQTLNKPSTIWQRLKNVAKVAKFRQICQDVNNLFFQSLVHIHLKILEESLTDDDLADFCSVLSKNLDKVLH